jgi:hypothetical protein
MTRRSALRTLRPMHGKEEHRTGAIRQQFVLSGSNPIASTRFSKHI